jgi:hypothetical protein
VVANDCVACPPGTTNEAGDDASGGDTACQDACEVALGVDCGALGDPTYVKASNTGTGDVFGWSVAVDGDTLAVGAPREASSASGVNGDQSVDSSFAAGAVYVFRRTGGVWAQEAYIKPSNPQADDIFGFSVSLSGDTLAVGAPFEDSNARGVDGDGSNNSASNSGAAYVFRRTGSTWEQEAYLKAAVSGPGDEFGYSIALSGDGLAVGARFEDSIATIVNGNQNDNSVPNAGAVYVFRRSGTTWAQEAYLKSAKQSGSGAEDQFGFSLAMDGDVVVVGAPFEDNDATGVNGGLAGAPGSTTSSDSGAAYVFRRNGSSWAQEAYVKASNTGSPDRFGWSVALSGDTIAVGADLESSNAQGVDGDQLNDSAQYAGAVYMFRRGAGNQWAQEAYLKGLNTESDDRFGHSLALAGDVLAVGAYFEDSAATGFGGNDANNTAVNAGAVYLFRRSSAQWAQEAYLKASNTGADDQFGYSIALSAFGLAVGAIFEDGAAVGVGGDLASEGAPDSGAAYVFPLGL